MTAPSRSRAERTHVVLVVEDDVVNQKVCAAMLKSIGYGVEIAVNGLEALACLERGHYAAVLMDCQMPVMDGYQATEELRHREGSRRHTPVIAVTASVVDSDRDLCLSAGMDGYLTKPFRVRDLDAALTQWLDLAMSPPLSDPGPV